MALFYALRNDVDISDEYLAAILDVKVESVQQYRLKNLLSRAPELLGRLSTRSGRPRKNRMHVSTTNSSYEEFKRVWKGTGFLSRLLLFSLSIQSLPPAGS
jgi:hypothetical protein